MKTARLTRLNTVLSFLTLISAQRTVFAPVIDCSNTDQPSTDEFYLSPHWNDGGIHPTVLEFVDSQGSVSPDISRSPQWTMSNGQLATNSTNGNDLAPRDIDSPVFVSTNGDVASQLFQVSLALQSISQTFSSSNDILVWQNENFDGGLARFCRSASSVNVVFRGPLPTGCGSILLKLYRGNGTSSSTTTNIASGTTISTRTAVSTTAVVITSVGTLTTRTTSTLSLIPSTSLRPSSTCTALPLLGLQNPLCTGSLLNLAQVDVNADGTCYQVSCGSQLLGDILPVNLTGLVDSLESCIAQCSLYNLANPLSCKGAQYNPPLLRKRLLGLPVQVPPILLPSVIPTDLLPTNLVPTAVVPTDVVPPASDLPAELPTDIIPPIELPSVVASVVDILGDLSIPTPAIASVVAVITELPVASLAVPIIENLLTDLPIPSGILSSVEAILTDLPLPTNLLPTNLLPTNLLPTNIIPPIQLPTGILNLGNCVLYSAVTGVQQAVSGAGSLNAAVLVDDALPILGGGLPLVKRTSESQE